MAAGRAALAVSRPAAAAAGLRIVLTGAGTSAYVGRVPGAGADRALGRRVEAIATTDLVASADSYLSADTPTLLVSFARSGNSPESIAAVETCRCTCARCAHLVVTCNAEGALYRRASTLANA